MLAAYLDNGYKFFLLLHLLSAFAAFGPLFVYPRLQRSDAVGLATLYMRLTLPAMVLTWVFGMGLVGLSDSVIEMSDAWITLSLLSWVAAIAVGWFLIRPATMSSGPDATKKLAMGTGITHLLLVVLLVLMVFKPGS